MDETAKSAIIDAVIARARSACPTVHLGTKYGGTVFMTDADTAASMVGGVFGYADHVSVEFSAGATFDDPNALLEGKGQSRRHIKLRSLSDIDAKDCAGFLAQAFA